MQRHDFRVFREASLCELDDTEIVVHAGDREADTLVPTAIDQPHRQITAPGADIEHRPVTLGVATHPLEHMAAQQTVARRHEAIDPLKLLERIAEQLR